MKCSICGKEIEKKYTATGEVYYDRGYYAEPINNGRCCNVCNNTKVIPERIKHSIMINYIEKEFKCK